MQTNERYMVEFSANELVALSVSGIRSLVASPSLTLEEKHHVVNAVEKLMMARAEIPDSISVRV